MQQKKIPLRGVFLTVLTITVLFMVSTSFSMPGSQARSQDKVWHAFDRAEPGTPAEIGAAASTEPGMNVTFTLKGFYSEEVVLNNKKWQRITFPDQGNIDRVGAPNVPIKRRLFAIPNNSSLEIEITDVEYQEFSNFNLEPFQRPLLETEKAKNRKFEKDKGLYKTDAFFPGEWASVADAGKIHGVNLARVLIHPVRFNPVQQTLQVANKITCRVIYSGTRAGEVETYPSNLDNVLKSLLLNYSFMDYRAVAPGTKGSTRAGTDYLMFCDPDLINASLVQDLVSYYSSQGLTVELIDVSTIGTTADQIKSYIQTTYDSQSPAELDFVLLIGDLDVIPWKDNAYSSYESDIWYGWLDGSDYVADVGVGRFPAKSQSGLNLMIQKTLDFQNNLYPGTWQNKSILIAHGQEYPGKYTECKETIYNHNYVLDPPIFDRKYGGEGATNAQVTSAINEGRLVVNYRGHGSQTAWTGWNTSGEYYDTGDANGLANGNKTPIVFSIACLCSDLGYSSNCLAEAFVCQDQGAVAFLGANDPSYTVVNHDFDRALYFGTWDLGIETIGDLYNYANAEVENIHGSSGYANMTMYLWLGDPAIRTVPGEPPTQYTLTTNTVGGGSITLDPSGGTYSEGTVVTLTAVPDAGWEFSGWSGDLSGSTNPTTITMSSNKSVTAAFTEITLPQYNLTVNIVGQGTVSLNPPGGTYYEGTEVTLTATADSGWKFDGWSGDLSGSTNPATITMNSDKTVTATFSEAGTTNTVGNTDVFGSTSVSTYRRAMPFTMPEDGDILSVTMYHDGGSGSMILGVYDGEGTPQNRLGVTAATAVSGSTGWQTISLTNPVPVAGGTTVWLAWVYENNPGIRYQTGSPGRYQSNDQWSGGMPDPFGSGSQSDFLYSIYATYEPGPGPIQYTLTTNTVGQGSITLNPPGGTYDEGTVVTLTAQPASGWQFDGWSGDLSGTQNPATITMNSDKNVTATFSEVIVPQYTLTVNTVGQGSVTLNPPGGTYDEGTVVTLTAQPASGWTFDYWTGDLTGSQNPDTITMDSDKTVTATFSEGVVKTVGNTEVFTSTSVSANRRAMPFTMPESGTIHSVTMYHDGGSGSMILAVYDGEGSPQNRLGITATTTVSGSTGWQTIDLTSPVSVQVGATIWLAWVYESNPGIAYQIGSPGRYQSGDTWSGGMPDPFGSGTQADFLYSIYATYTPGGGPLTVGYTQVFGSISTTPNRRAMPFTMPEDGTIESVSMYHEGGSGSMILAVYDGATLPQNRLGVTAVTTVNSSAGWQTINLTNPVFVQGGTAIWLAWVYESIPGVRYEIGSPGRAQSADLWAGGMPDPFGSSTQSDFIYTIYATYIQGPTAPAAQADNGTEKE
jgi:uncharacterized repeat protein (TIGR02543 family)